MTPKKHKFEHDAKVETRVREGVKKPNLILPGQELLLPQAASSGGDAPL